MSVYHSQIHLENGAWALLFPTFWARTYTQQFEIFPSILMAIDHHNKLFIFQVRVLDATGRHLIQSLNESNHQNCAVLWIYVRQSHPILFYHLMEKYRQGYYFFIYYTYIY